MDSFRNFVANEDFFHQAILGNTAVVNTVGIITAENPELRKFAKVTNEKKNEELLAHLRKLGYEPVQIKGKFLGRSENPFLLFNVSLEEMIKLKEKFKQDVVIFGKKVKGSFVFSYVANQRSRTNGRLHKEQPAERGDKDSYIKLGKEKYTIKF